MAHLGLAAPALVAFLALATAVRAAPGAPRATSDAPRAPSAESGETADGAETEARSGYVLVPLVLYTPETHLGLGAFFVRFFSVEPAQEMTRVPNFAIVLLVTTRYQAILEFHLDYYGPSDDFHTFGKLEFQRFPDSFWGVGAASDQAEERYERNKVRFRGGAEHRLVGALYGGVATDLMYYQAHYPDSNGIFASQEIVGERGGFTGGFGPMLTLDTRDHSVAAHRGSLVNLALLGFSSALSRYEFMKLSLDTRTFFPLGAEQVLALQAVGEFQAGTVPYYHLATLGGDELLRGYYLGRYRDRTRVALQAEYRRPLFWRLGGVLFAGAGQVAARPADLVDVPVRWSVGGGLRFSLNDQERLNLRLDVGAGPGTYGVYFTAREVF